LFFFWDLINVLEENLLEKLILVVFIYKKRKKKFKMVLKLKINSHVKFDFLAFYLQLLKLKLYGRHMENLVPSVLLANKYDSHIEFGIILNIFGLAASSVIFHFFKNMQKQKNFKF
jgi:hypothetical protein